MGALDVSKGTVKSIYALGAKLGMVERGGGHVVAPFADGRTKFTHVELPAE